MPTTYGMDLPAVPPDRWEAHWQGGGGDVDEGTAYSNFLINAGSAEEAERRLLAHVDHAYEDDIRGAVATAAATDRPGRWQVRINLARPRS